MMPAASGPLAPALDCLIRNPSLALVLILVSIFLLYVEFNRPGTVVYAALGVFSLTLGGYALLHHPVNVWAALVMPLGIGLAIAGLRFHPAGALSILVLTWALHNLLREDLIGVPEAFLVSVAFVVVTTWLGLFALQARLNKRLPIREVQPSIPTPHPAAPARRVD